MVKNRFESVLTLAGTLSAVFIIVLAAALLTSPSIARTPAAVAVGLVPSESGVNDQGYNQLAYEGLLRAETSLGVTGSVYTPTGESEYEAKLQECVDAGNDLCISVSFMMADATRNIANANPGTLFAIAESEEPSPPDNLRGIMFASDEAGYLAGTLAGLMTESDMVGGVGGMQIPAVEAFLEPYRIAAECANLQATVILTYTGTFLDPELGAQVAQQMLDQGADVIFGAAGPTGNGAILTATQSGAWAIGVDVDQYFTLFQGGAVAGADHLLTSASKRVDNAVYQTIADVVAGTFTAGTVVYGLADDGVGLAPYHESDPYVPQSVRDRLEAVRLGIINGTIDTYEPCEVYRVYLPLVISGFSQ